MTAVKIDRSDEIDELLTKIYLDTGIKLSKKELLEIIFDQSSSNYEKLLSAIQKTKTTVKMIDTIEVRREFMQRFAGIITDDIEEIDPKSMWATGIS